MNSARTRAYLMLLAVATIWGIASPVIKYTLDGFPAPVFLAYRFGISTVIAIVIFFIHGVHLPKTWNVFLLMLLYSFLNSTVGLGLLFFGMDQTTVLESSLITLVTPLLVSTAGVYFLHEHITLRERIGMGIAIAGTVLTIMEPLINNGHSALKLSGNILVLGYVIVTVVCAILAKKLLREEVDPMTMTNFSFILGFLSFLPVAVFTTTTSITQVAAPYHMGVFYMAILSGTLAFYLSNKAQKSIEIGEASVFSYLYPLFSLPLAIWWLGEKITPTYILGGIIIAIGVVIAEIKKKRYNT